MPPPTTNAAEITPVLFKHCFAASFEQNATCVNMMTPTDRVALDNDNAVAPDIFTIFIMHFAIIALAKAFKEYTRTIKLTLFFANDFCIGLNTHSSLFGTVTNIVYKANANKPNVPIAKDISSPVGAFFDLLKNSIKIPRVA